MRPRSWERGSTIVSEPLKSNRPVRKEFTATPVARWCEAGLDLCVLALPPLLAMAPHGIAPLAGFAGLCAVGLAAAKRPLPLAALRAPAAIFGALVLWGALSALWSIDRGRSLVLDVRLAGLFLAALALAAAAPLVARPGRLGFCLVASTAFGALLALGDLVTAGGLSHHISIRAFGATRLNQLAVWLALLALPASAFLATRSGRLLALLAAAAMALVVVLLDDTGAKIALALSLPAAAAFGWRRATVARIAAGLAIIALVTAPLTLPRLASWPRLFAAADAFKDSAGHRLLIWSFTGDRIAERPFLGWGLDSSRAIPGGRDEIRPAQNWLPLHPHDAALQVWLELGAPGAALFALVVALLWLRLATAPWPRFYSAAAGGSYAAALAVTLGGWGVWQEWWLGTLSLALFAVIVMARASESGRVTPSKDHIPGETRVPSLRIPSG
jgi:O-antigen ligase